MVGSPEGADRPHTRGKKDRSEFSRVESINLPVVGSSSPYGWNFTWDPVASATSESRHLAPSEIPLSTSVKKVELSGRLPKSKTVGLLLRMNDVGALNHNGQRRLSGLLVNLSETEMLTALNFRETLREHKVLQSFKHHAVVLNSPTWRNYLKNSPSFRIGKGYSDKGSQPAPDAAARRRAHQDGFHHRTEFESLYPQWAVDGLLGDEEWTDDLLLWRLYCVQPLAQPPLGT